MTRRAAPLAILLLAALLPGCPPADENLSVTIDALAAYDECDPICLQIAAALELTPAAGAGVRTSADGETWHNAGALDSAGEGEVCIDPKPPGSYSTLVEVSYQQRTSLQSVETTVLPFGTGWGLDKDGALPDPLPVPQIARRPDNPVLEVGEPGTWDATTVMMPSVAPLDDGWLMLYAGRVDDYQIGAAVSDDGIAWTRLDDDPVIPAGVAAWAADSTNSPSLLADDGELLAWFHGAADGHTSIGLARSDDGETWTLVTDAAVLEPGGEGDWDAGSVAHPAVLRRGGVYEMWYASGATEGELRLGHALSTDGVEWVKYCRNPVFDAAAGWEGNSTKSPEVFRHDGLYHLLFSAGGTQAWQVGHAVSVDGLRWARSTEEPVLPAGDAGAWDEQATLNAFALADDDGIRIWYSGTPPAPGPAAVGVADVDGWE